MAMIYIATLPFHVGACLLRQYIADPIRILVGSGNGESYCALFRCVCLDFCHESIEVREVRKQGPNCGAHGSASQCGEEDKPGIDLDNGDSSAITGVVFLVL